MIRQPTSRADALAWWRAALLDSRTSRHDAEPQAGFYKRRMVKNGPFVPVEVALVSVVDDAGELIEPETYTADQLGWEQDPAQIWTHLRPISQDEFDALVEEHRTSELMQATHAAVDLSKTPIGPRGY